MSPESAVYAQLHLACRITMYKLPSCMHTFDRESRRSCAAGWCRLRARGRQVQRERRQQVRARAAVLRDQERARCRGDRGSGVPVQPHVRGALPCLCVGLLSSICGMLSWCVHCLHTRSGHGASSSERAKGACSRKGLQCFVHGHRNAPRLCASATPQKALCRCSTWTTPPSPCAYSPRVSATRTAAAW